MTSAAPARIGVSRAEDARRTRGVRRRRPAAVSGGGSADGGSSRQVRSAQAAGDAAGGAALGRGRRRARRRRRTSSRPSAGIVGKRLIGVKPGIVLISERKIRSPRDQEVDAGEALGADRPVRVARDLEDRAPSDRGWDLGRGGGLGQPGRVLRGVVVELVAGDDLARAVQLERAWSLPMTLTSRSRAPGEVRLDEGDRVVAERQRRAPRGSSAEVVDEGDPDRRPEAATA